MLDKKIHLVSATQLSEDEFWNNTKLGKCLKKHETLGNIDSYTIFFGNKTGLPKLYNTFFTEKWKDYNVIFCHDDVEILHYNLKETLNEGHINYNIIGVAGTKVMINKSPIVWHNYCIHKTGVTPQHIQNEVFAGTVYHPTPSNHLQANYFGTMPKRVAMIDGLFMSVNMDSLYNNTACLFDEDFDFHFYDLSFCIRNLQENKTIGVWNIPTLHNSRGNYDSEAWRSAEGIFIEKYGQKNG